MSRRDGSIRNLVQLRAKSVKTRLAQFATLFFPRRERIRENGSEGTMFMMFSPYFFYETFFSRRRISKVNGVPSESVLRFESFSTFHNRAMALSKYNKCLDPSNISNGDSDLVFNRSGIFINLVKQYTFS